MSRELEPSIIITTYNRPEALRLVLHSVIRQTRPPMEIIIADDGSGPGTAEVVEKVLKRSDLRWRHVRQEDKGIRQARVKNLGCKYSKGNYLIFLDHDVVLHPEFILDHVSDARKGVFLQGKRSLIPESFTDKYLSGGSAGPPGFLTPGLENRKNVIHLPRLGRWLSRRKRFQTALRGCNLSIHREDFFMVDGYDETFDQLWGREDSDICYRLFHNGVRVKNLWFSAVQYHLYHRNNKNHTRDRLDEELDRVLTEKRVKAVRGFSQLSAEGEIIAES